MPFFSDLRDYLHDVWTSDWLPIPRIATVCTLVCLLWFCWYEVGKRGGDFLFLDWGNLIIHEAGHPLFSWLGDFMGAAGGTLLQLLVPFLLAMGFYVRRQPVGYAIFLMVLWENLIYVSWYMSTARSLEGQFVAIGSGGGMDGSEIDPNMHDWHNMFSRLGLLQYDTRISRLTFFAAWIGMIATVLWFAWQAWRSWDENAELDMSNDITFRGPF